MLMNCTDMEKTEENIFKKMQRKGYSGLALYKVTNGAVMYNVIAVSESDAKNKLKEHFEHTGMVDVLDKYDQIEMYAADAPVNIRYPDHDLKVTLKAKEWAAIFDTNRPEWGIVGCSEWN